MTPPPSENPQSGDSALRTPHSALWSRPATVERNRFKYKSLSSFSYNIAVGCEHACRFCYVPAVSTGKGAMAAALRARGVADPDAQWGDYVFLRPWHAGAFMASLHKAERTHPDALNADGHRAVMLSTTTDPYQVMRGHDATAGGPLREQRRFLVREALFCILKFSSLNVRILTRSPLAREDFELMRQFGPRLMFGMSLPTLNNQLSKLYEPHAPAPSQRLATLRAAKAAGLHVYVAMAPTYPECDAADMNATLRAIRELEPRTVFMEPINIRAENVARIAAHAASLGVPFRGEVFADSKTWAAYAFEQLDCFESTAIALNFQPHQIHLWPDAGLATHADARRKRWLETHWSKISAWPIKL
jgi:DNA repair photolyase